MMNLDDHTAPHHILSIRLAPNGFSFFILNVLDHKVANFSTTLVAEHQDVVLIALNALRTNEIFTYPYKEVRILIDSPDVTVVPSDVFVDDEKESLFQLNIDLAENEYVLVNSSPTYNVEVLFSIQKELYAFFTKNFPRIKIIHNMSLMLHQAYYYENIAQEQLFISYSGSHFSVVGMKDNSFVFHNCFNMVTAEDLIYYFLLVIQDLGFDQYESSAVLTGVIDEDENELNVIRQYLAKLDFKSLPKQCTYNDQVLEMPAHYYANFFALPFCE